MLIRRLARPMLASYFVLDGVNNLKKPQEAAAEAAPFVELVSQQTGLPNNPELVVRGIGSVKLIGGVLLATGRVPRVAATSLALTQLANTYVHEAFWAESDPKAKARKQQNFVRNVAILGGVILAAVDTEGKPSLRWRAVRGAGETGRAARRTARQTAKAAKLEAKLLASQAGNALP